MALLVLKVISADFFVVAQRAIDLLFLSRLVISHVNFVDRLLTTTKVGEVDTPYLIALELSLP